jgi:hypothetical protein
MGWELYRPIGLDWFSQGYWKIAEPYGNAQDTINQYLDINERGYHPYKNLNGEHYVEDGVYHVYDGGHNYYHRAITVEKFAEMDIDIIISTYEPHDSPYVALRDKYHPKAKLVAQMGNTGQKSVLPNVIHSVPYTPPAGQRAFYYHQEIDPEIYSCTPPNPGSRKIFSFVNLYPYADIYNTFNSLLHDVQMKYYGSGCPDGALNGAMTVSKKMQEANIGWHLKPQDGFGHTAMGWFASGRPVITNMSQVVGWGGDAPILFEPGVTCLNIEAYTVHDACREIRKMLEPEANAAWGDRAYKRFKDIFNYDREAEQLKVFLEGII